MHIVLGALAVIGAIVYWWFIYGRTAVDAGRDLADAADDVRSAVRRFGYRRKLNQHPAEAVEDPRLAAAAMMHAIARMDGAETAAQRDQIKIEAQAVFRVDGREAGEIAAFGRWLADQSHNPDELMRRVTTVVRDRADPEAHRDLIAMLQRVAAVEDGVSDVQEQAIERLERALGLAKRTA